MLVPAIDRRRPALRPAAGGLAEDVEDLADGRLLYFRRHLQEILVLGIAVALDHMAGLDDLLDGIGVELGSAAIAEHRRLGVTKVESADEAPDAFRAAVLGPLHAGVIDGAAAQRRGAGEIGRRLAVGPAFEKHADENRHALAVRPRKPGREPGCEPGCRHASSSVVSW